MNGMKSFLYIRRNLVYHRKSLLSTIAGIAVSAAVLTGAFTVGDSVKYSLVSIAGNRLGNTTMAVRAAESLFNNSLADSLANQLNCFATPLLITRGIAIHSESDSRINQVEVIGIRKEFPALWNDSMPELLPGEAVVSSNVASKLKLAIGNEFLVRVVQKGNTPRNAPFIADDKPSISRRLKLKAIAPETGFGRFSLQSNQSPPFNIFVRLDEFSDSRDAELAANLVLLDIPTSDSISNTLIERTLQTNWSLKDAGIRIRPLPAEGTFELVSDRVFIGESTLEALQSIHPGVSAHLTYLVNEIRHSQVLTPYSFVSAVSRLPGAASPGKGEIVLNSWLAADLGASAGDTINLSYFVMGPQKSLREENQGFRVSGIIPVKDDRLLMPEFPGMNEAGSCREWETGAPIDLKKIRDKDEDYWNEFRGTPKAYISMEDGLKIWSNPFGSYTGFRFEADSLDVQRISLELPDRLTPSGNGIQILPVSESGQQSAENATDFGELFLGLGFFIILSGIILTALLSGLYFSKRINETGILTAIGFSKKSIYFLFMAESLVIAVIGSMVGSLAGIFYNNLMIRGLNTIWQGAVGTVMLSPHLEVTSILAGFLAACLVSFSTMIIILRMLLKQQPSLAIKGATINRTPKFDTKKNIFRIISPLLIAGGVILTLLSLTGLAPGPVFALSAGGILLCGLLLFIFYRMTEKQDNATTLIDLRLLVLRNLQRKRKRSIAVISMIALGTFSLLITAINHKINDYTNRERGSGTGGFLFWAETSIPLRLDLSSVEGRTSAGLADEAELQGLTYEQCYRLHRDDASCLNLNQVSDPGIIGINPKLFDTLGAFGFQATEHFVDPAHPWLTLENQQEPNIIYAFADQTVITWGLRKKTGDTLLYIAENGESLKIVIAGGLKNSIFQGNLLIASNHLRKHFPSSASPDLILVDGMAQKPEAASSRLEFLLSDYGFTIMTAAAKLDSFLVVQNTYLSVFLVLGGIGMIIGIVGLGILLLRNLQERKAEIALYSSLGFQGSTVQRIMVSEYGLLLAAGMFSGILSALPLILQVVKQQAGDIPWLLLLLVLLLVLLNGFVWIWLPARKFLKQNLITTLRTE